MTDPRIAVSLSPGGVPGIDAHVGVWAAFEDAGIAPTQLYGCSAGAVVGALWASGRYTGHEAVDLVRGFKSSDVVRKRRAWKARVFWLEHFCDPAPIEALLEQHLPPTFADLEIPLAVSATVMREHPVAAYLDSGNLRRAVLASLSIAGVWPYVEIGPELYSDGGTTDAIVLPFEGGGILPLEQRYRGYDAVYVINLVEDPYANRDKNVISRLLWNVEQLQRFERVLAREEAEEIPNVHWLDVRCHRASCLEFDHGRITSSYAQVIEWLARLQEGARAESAE